MVLRKRHAKLSVVRKLRGFVAPDPPRNVNALRNITWKSRSSLNLENLSAIFPTQQQLLSVLSPSVFRRSALWWWWGWWWWCARSRSQGFSRRSPARCYSVHCYYFWRLLHRTDQNANSYATDFRLSLFARKMHLILISNIFIFHKF